VLFGTVTPEQAGALTSRLEGLADSTTEHADIHKTNYMLKTMNRFVKLSVSKKMPSKDSSVHPVSVLHYQGVPDTQAHDRITTRTVVKAHTGDGAVNFLQDIGFKFDYEVVMKGKQFKCKQIETYLYKVLKLVRQNDISSVQDISTNYLVEVTAKCMNLSDPVVVELLSFADSLKPIVRLEKYDPSKISRDNK